MPSDDKGASLDTVGSGDLIPVKTMLNKQQVDFLQSIVDAGFAINKPDAIRHIIVRAMKSEG